MSWRMCGFYFYPDYFTLYLQVGNIQRNNEYNGVGSLYEVQWLTSKKQRDIKSRDLIQTVCCKVVSFQFNLITFSDTIERQYTRTYKRTWDIYLWKPRFDWILLLSMYVLYRKKAIQSLLEKLKENILINKNRHLYLKFMFIHIYVYKYMYI